MRLILLLFYLSLYGCVSEKNIQQIYTGDFIEKNSRKFNTLILILKLKMEGQF